MKKVIEKIYGRLQKGKTIAEKYPEMVENDGKIHVLYLHCLINSKGLYRMVLPYYELNKTDTHAAVIGTMHKWDFTKSFFDYDNIIEQELIEWADYIILPDFAECKADMLSAFKSINPAVKISLDISDFAFNQSEEQLLDKLKQYQGADLLSFNKAAIADRIEQLVKLHYPKHQLSFAVIPDLISVENFYQLKRSTDGSNGKVRIGFIGQPNIVQRLTDIEPFLRPIIEKNQEKIQLVSLGWRGKKDSVQPFKELNIEYHKPVNISNYYKKVHSLNLDLVILTTFDNEEDEITRSPIKYIELAALGIPTAIGGNSKLSSVVADNKTGIIIRNNGGWTWLVKRLLNDLESIKHIGHVAQKVAWKQMSWNRFKANLLANTYL